MNCFSLSLVSNPGLNIMYVVNRVLIKLFKAVSLENYSGQFVMGVREAHEGLLPS